MLQITVVTDRAQATHELCELNPNCRSKGRKWMCRHLVSLPEGITGPQVAASVIDLKLATAREIKRKQVTLVPLRPEREKFVGVDLAVGQDYSVEAGVIDGKVVSVRRL